MAGATASALMGLMNPLLSNLSSLVEREYGKLKGVWREIDFLREELSSMKAALEVVSDLEEPGLQVKEWMRQVRELSYDVEDCINDFMYHLDQDDASDSLIHKISHRLKALRARHRIASQITELKKHSEEVSNRQKRYEHSMAPSSSSSVAVDPKLPALFEEVDRLVGIKGPMDELIKWLTEDTDSEKQRKVISIVGFGGLGKTTLANQVYQQIRSQFDCTAFVSVSRNPIINKVLADILTGLIETSNPPHLKICLLHLSAFPEDSEIDRSHLIWRWIAEGSIAKQRGHNLEEVGEKYFNELVNRNMIQPIGINYCGRARACRVHDIMLDIIISLSTG